jgi:hypothetical protein
LKSILAAVGLSVAGTMALAEGGLPLTVQNNSLDLTITAITLREETSEGTILDDILATHLGPVAPGDFADLTVDAAHCLNLRIYLEFEGAGSVSGTENFDDSVDLCQADVYELRD